MRHAAEIATELRERSFCLVGGYLSAEHARAIRAMYDDASLFRSRVVMEKHAFGPGEYQYFADPVPLTIRELRETLYAQLAPIANEWMSEMGSERRFPLAHQAFLDECFAANQTKPTALLLRYEAGDYNCLHQDLYGPVAFPFQATIYLSAPGEEFEGGELRFPEFGDQRYRPETGAAIVFSSSLLHEAMHVTAGTRYVLLAFLFGDH